MGSAALPKHAYGLHRNSTSQSSVYNVNSGVWMACRRPKFPGARISEKNVLFLKFIGPVISLCVLYPSEIMHMGSTENLLARAVFARSNKMLGWQPGAPKSREHGFPKKIS